MLRQGFGCDATILESLRQACAEHHHVIEELSKLKGEEFDRAYMKEMVDDHEHDVEKFRQEAKEAKDPEVKSFAAKTLPTLEAHLRMAKDVANEVRATTSGAGKHPM